MFDENLSWQPEMRGQPQDFYAHRLVIDLELNPNDPDVEINFKVYFTHRDLANIKRIKLLKWNGSNWIAFPIEPIPLHNNQIWAGYFDVPGFQIGDPPIALGE